MSETKVIMVDMDGVIVHYDPALHGTDTSVDFQSLEPIPGAIEAVRGLIAMGHDVFIATTAPWCNPMAWTAKRLWIEVHLPEMKKRVFMTHRKDMLMGDYLIDDRTANGAGEFKGLHLHFGQTEFPDWAAVIAYFQKLTQG